MEVFESVKNYIEKDKTWKLLLITKKAFKWYKTFPIVGSENSVTFILMKCRQIK